MGTGQIEEEVYAGRRERYPALARQAGEQLAGGFLGEEAQADAGEDVKERRAKGTGIGVGQLQQGALGGSDVGDRIFRSQGAQAGEEMGVQMRIASHQVKLVEEDDGLPATADPPT